MVSARGTTCHFETIGMVIVDQVLYRKWRPQTLDDVIGQEHITRILHQAVLQGKIANAYLFCGPRGTGKTSTARILAKAITCEQSVGGEPCNSCRICINVNDGKSLDLFEIDAASNRGIDDIRELRERVNFAPAESSHKVYIIDEAQQLTDAANNAFLKTLEEPPPHVVFILATTEPQKILGTVASRCQRFDFHRISQEHILKRLTDISNKEQINIESSALVSIARNSSGSLRDAVNLLEQLSVSSDSNIRVEDIRNIFAIGDDSVALEFVECSLSGQVREALLTINDISEKGLDISRFQRQVVDHLRNLLLVKSGVDNIVDQAPEIITKIKGIAEPVPLEHILRTLKIFETATQNIYGPNTLFMETALVESCIDVGEKILYADEVSTQNEITAMESLIPDLLHEAPIEESNQEIDNIKARPIIKEPTEYVDDYYAINANDVSKASEYGPEPLKDSSRENENQIDSTKEIGDSMQDIQEPVLKVSNGGANELTESHWMSIRSATRHLKFKYNIGSLLLGTENRYIEDGTLFLVFKTRSNLERLQGEIDNPDVRRSLIDIIEKATGVRYDLSLIMMEQKEGYSNGPSGHLVQTARSLGAIIEGESEEEK
ncbi:MAG: DNA polymerase III subunit gamma/tau [SAR202 cluster bacterium]|nr:DNA polymerase III subunit gamma/tau [SAR202 cluster bacterium]